MIDCCQTIADRSRVWRSSDSSSRSCSRAQNITNETNYQKRLVVSVRTNWLSKNNDKELSLRNNIEYANYWRL